MINQSVAVSFESLRDSQGPGQPLDVRHKEDCGGQGPKPSQTVWSEELGEHALRSLGSSPHLRFFDGRIYGREKP